MFKKHHYRLVHSLDSTFDFIQKACFFLCRRLVEKMSLANLRGTHPVHYLNHFNWRPPSIGSDPPPKDGQKTPLQVRYPSFEHENSPWLSWFLNCQVVSNFEKRNHKGLCLCGIFSSQQGGARWWWLREMVARNGLRCGSAFSHPMDLPRLTIIHCKSITTSPEVTIHKLNVP